MDIARVGYAIATLRRQAGMTQRELAARLSVSDKAVSKWERGLGLPDIGYLRKLAMLLDTDTDSLLAGGTFQHSMEWVGILILPQERQDITACTMVYNKPLIDYLISYFLLVGISDIIVRCGEKEWAEIEEYFAKRRLPMVRVRWAKNEQTCRSFCAVYKNCMVVKGNVLLYGVGMTSFLQRAMGEKHGITGLAIPAGENHSLRKVVFNERRMACTAITENNQDCSARGYDYREVPIYFCATERCAEVVANEICTPYYVEPVNRGFIAWEIVNWDDLATASEFIRLTQTMTGLAVGDLDEIIRRRGLDNR